MSEPVSKRERVSRLIQRAGITGGRAAQQLCADGSVTIDGVQVSDWGARATPDNVVRLYGSIVPWSDRPTAPDPRLSGPPTVWRYNHTAIHLPPETSHAICSYKDHGLQFRTNDQDLGDLVRYGVRSARKVYLAKVFGDIEPGDVEAIAAGRFNGENFRPLIVSITHHTTSNTYIRAETCGANCTGLFRVFDRRISNLRRCAIGSVTVEGLPGGATAELDREAFLAEFGCDPDTDLDQEYREIMRGS